MREVKYVRNEDEPVATKGKLVFIPLVGWFLICQGEDDFVLIIFFVSVYQVF